MRQRNWMVWAVAGVLAVPVLATQVRADEWAVDGTHSGVTFSVMHMDIALFYGRFNEITGTYSLEDDPSFSFTVPVASVDTGNEQRDGHLKNEDFFDAATYPEIAFVSTAVERDGDTYKVTGDLTLHGVTKPIDVEIVKTGEGEMRGTQKSGIASTFTIKRSDFGMTNMIGPVGDEVTLMIGIEGDKQE